MDADDEFAARLVGQTVGGRWRLERLLGTGGMAAVYAARDDDGNVAALKILHPEMSLRHDVRERFLREAYVANRVAHPGAVQVLEHSSDESGSTYLVMELLEGEPLSARVRRLGMLPVPELVEYLDQILDVLVHAHEAGIIHRDLKPDNLFVTNEGRIKILDFGLARMLDDVPGDFKTRTGMALGTLPYMAPEQALGRRNEIDGRVDLFALGATAFRILAGRKVHEANSEAELLIAMASKPAPPLASVAPDVPPGLRMVIDMSLAFAKEARYPDARTMQSDVRAVRDGKLPPYANSQSAAREESTRIDMPAAPAATVAAAAASSDVAPASARSPAGSPQDPATAPTAPAGRSSVNPFATTAKGTAVLPQMSAAALAGGADQAVPRNVTPAPGSVAAVAGPDSMRGGATAGQEPMHGALAPGPASVHGGMMAGPASMHGAAAGPASPHGGTTMGPGTPAPGTLPLAVAPSTPPPAKKRSALPWVLAILGVLLLIGGAVAVAAVYFVEKDGGALPELELPGSGSAAPAHSAPADLAGKGGAADQLPGSGGTAAAVEPGMPSPEGRATATRAAPAATGKPAGASAEPSPLPASKGAAEPTPTIQAMQKPAVTSMPKPPPPPPKKGHGKGHDKDKKKGKH